MEESTYMYKRADHSTNIDNMRLSGRYCDVVIKTKNKQFPAHKVILAANLKYFELMFANYNEDTNQDGVIFMTDVDERYLEAFISFAYSGRILLTDTNVFGVLQMATNLKEKEVKIACTQFLKVHLKLGNACQVFAVASRIKCLPLKNAAGCFISCNFENCSQTQEFLEFDYHSMKHILSKTIVAYPDSRQILFQGLIRWVLYNVNIRRKFTNDLFNIINLAKLNKDYLLEYVSENINNESFIVKDVMSSYRNQISQHKDENQLSLIVIGDTNDHNLHAQVWYSSDKKWSTPYQIIQSHGHQVLRKNWIVFDHTLFNLVIDQTNKEISLVELITPGMHCRTLISDSKLIRGSAMCASRQFIYLCGGRRKDGSVSAQFIRYDPCKNCLEILPEMTTERYEATAIIYQECLYVLGGRNKSSQLLKSVERYNPITRKWSTLEGIHTPRYKNLGVAVLDNKFYIGHSRGVAVYEPLTERLQSIASMQIKNKFRFDLVCHEGQLLAFVIGDNNEKIIEKYDPIKNEWKADLQLSTGLKVKYLKGGLIIFNQSRKRVRPFEAVEENQKKPKLKAKKRNRFAKKVVST